MIRLFRRGKARFSENLVHESLQVTGNVARLRTSLLHYSYTSMDQVHRKSAQYAEAGARDLAQRGKHIGALSPVLHGTWAFVRTLVLRRGVPGWRHRPGHRQDERHGQLPQIPAGTRTGERREPPAVTRRRQARPRRKPRPQRPAASSDGWTTSCAGRFGSQPRRSPVGYCRSA